VNTITPRIAASRTTPSHTLTLPWVTEVTQGFVFCDDMREAVSLALAAGVNLILSGPGGHAKSEFLEAVFRAIAGQETFVKSFGQGTSCEELFGGIDFDALNRDEGATLQYHPQLSFLNHPIAVFEELFDAPPRVVTSLKDTLTAKELRNGHQRHPMLTRVIAAATNHSPQEIAEGGPEIEALIQRFPIQLEVKWDNYSKEAFVQLFAAVIGREEAGAPAVTWLDIETLQQKAKEATVSSGMRSLLAQVVVELIKDKVSISPRTAIMALQLAKAAAAINGRSRVVPADLKAIAYLPGAIHLRRRIDELIEELAGTLEAEEKLEQAEQELAGLVARFNATSSVVDLQQISSEADRLARSIQILRVSADQTGRRHTLVDSAMSLANEAGDAESALALNQFESTLQMLQEKLGEASSIDEHRAFCASIRELVTGIIALTIRGMHAQDRNNRIINEAQALLHLAEEGLKEAEMEAGVDGNAQRLEKFSSDLTIINKRLDRARTSAEKRGPLMWLADIEAELSQMLVHASLQADFDAVMSKIRVIKINASR
jgi:MoxR-like ATPase